MNFKTTMLLPLVLSAAFATAAEANYFSNPRLNIHSNVGSAPSPRPVDIRENRMPRISESSFPTAMVKVSPQEAQYFNIVVETGGPKTVAANTSSD